VPAASIRIAREFASRIVHCDSATIKVASRDPLSAHRVRRATARSPASPGSVRARRAPLNPIQEVSRRAGTTVLGPTGCQELVLPRQPRLPRRRPTLIATPVPTAVATLVPAPVSTMVSTVAIAVMVIVAGTPVEVEAPLRVPIIAWAPVIQRRKARLGLGGTRRQPQTGQPQTCGHQHRRCKTYASPFHA
jgi:hypothetical protein